MVVSILYHLNAMDTDYKVLRLQILLVYNRIKLNQKPLEKKNLKKVKKRKKIEKKIKL